MAKTKSQKAEMLESYLANLDNYTGIIMLSQSGLKPSDVNSFKERLSQSSSTYGVVKNTIFKLALEKAGLPEIGELNEGPTSVVYTSEDVASAAKTITEFMKEHKEKVVIKAGILDGQALSVDQVKDLSELPTKEQSVAMIAGLLQQNMSGVVNVLEDSIRSVAIILDKAFTE